MDNPVSKRFTLINDEYMTLDIEYTDEATIIHMHEIKKFNKSVLKHIVLLIDNLADWLVPQFGAIFTYAHKDRDDIRRLVHHAGFVEAGGHEDYIFYRRE